MKKGTVGILPAGALGVSFFYHLTGKLERRDGTVFFVGPDRSRSIDSLLASDLQIAVGEQLHRLPFRDHAYRTLGTAWEADAMPEILLVCPNPDQLLPVLSTVVELLERIYAEDPDSFEQLELPAIILSANGIYFQRVRQMFIEKLEESTLLGRLPDLWPDMMPAIVGHLLRGVTIQTGLRKGSGAGTVYYPGPPGDTILIGGSEQVRQRCYELLSSLGGPVELGKKASPTRLEFEKAIINLMSNLLGLLCAFDEEGNFRLLQVAQILNTENEPAARELARHVFEVGCAVKAFSKTEDFEHILDEILARCRRIGTHVPSSLQYIDLQIQGNCLQAQFPPTETWLINPLIHYARSAGLTEAVDYFEGLRESLLAKMEKAVQRQTEAIA